jgi:hypothetical protein
MYEELVDNPLFDLDWHEYPIANECLNVLVSEKTSWMNDDFIENFINKYKYLSINPLDEISLLMCEASQHIKDDKAVFDIFIAGNTNFESFKSRIYLLHKTTFYCNEYFYPMKIFWGLEKEAKTSNDYRLLADALRSLYDKYAADLLDLSLLDDIEKYLFKSEQLMLSDYDKLSLAISMKKNKIEKGDALFKFTMDALFLSTEKCKNNYQLIRELLSSLYEDYDLFARDTEDAKFISDDDLHYSMISQLSDNYYKSYEVKI